jgi:hypothetical protein
MLENHLNCLCFNKAFLLTAALHYVFHLVLFFLLNHKSCLLYAQMAYFKNRHYNKRNHKENCWEKSLINSIERDCKEIVMKFDWT